MNSGVMVLNIDGLLEIDVDFKRFITAHVSQLVGQHWDQGAYQRFFGALERTRWHAELAEVPCAEIERP